MSFTKKENAFIKECYYYTKHKSGLDVYVIPKSMATTYALFGTRFGSIDNHFTLDGREMTLPDGIAHFLEHKMFENEDGTDTFERYAATGADANAYTTFERTCYLFSATDKVYESLEILLDFVTHPYFTKETVAKEQGIIGQEIRMYDDNPGWQLYFGMLTALYHNNTVRIDTAGTAETIAVLTPELLTETYRAFYDLHNMALVVCGNATPEEVERVCDKVLRETKAPEVTRIYPDEPKAVKTAYIEKKMEVAMPMFSVGIKDNDLCDGRALARKEAEYEILLTLLFGRSSPFYTRLYESGLIDSGFAAEYEGTPTFAHCVISGTSKEPKKVYEEIRAEIKKYKEEGIDRAAFERVKRASFAGSLRDFNSTEEIADSFLLLRFSDEDLLDVPEIIDAVTYEDVTARLQNGFADDAFTLSVILPRTDN